MVDPVTLLCVTVVVDGDLEMVPLACGVLVPGDLPASPAGLSRLKPLPVGILESE